MDNWKNINLLVTGGYGFIGSNFIRYMFRKYPGIKIINLDALTYAGNRDNLREFHDDPRYTEVIGNIKDEKIVGECMSKADAVVHFAAESHVDRSISSAAEFIQTNVFGTYVLLNETLKSIKKGHEIKKFVMISTDEVYGDVPAGISSTEMDMINPRNPYAASKAGADRLAYSYHQTHGLPVVITRSSNNFGPYQNTEKMLPRFITSLMKDKKVPLYGDGKNIRDWLYVEDNCQAIETVLIKGVNGEVYNIGGGNEKENIEITNKLLGSFGKGKESIEYVEDRLGHDRRYSLDSGKINNELGWSPKRPFDIAFEETINWYKENENWWG